jgi:hypothetical protein
VVNLNVQMVASLPKCIRKGKYGRRCAPVEGESGMKMTKEGGRHEEE